MLLAQSLTILWISSLATLGLLILIVLAFNKVLSEVWRDWGLNKRSIATVIAISCIVCQMPIFLAAGYFEENGPPWIFKALQVTQLTFFWGAGIFGAIGLIWDRRIARRKRTYGTVTEPVASPHALQNVEPIEIAAEQSPSIESTTDYKPPESEKNSGCLPWIFIWIAGLLLGDILRAFDFTPHEIIGDAIAVCIFVFISLWMGWFLVRNQAKRRPREYVVALISSACAMLALWNFVAIYTNAGTNKILVFGFEDSGPPQFILWFLVMGLVAYAVGFVLISSMFKEWKKPSRED